MRAYLTYGRGYKAGGFQLDRTEMNPLSPSLTQLEFNPETAISYEAGVKGSTLNGELRLNAALFRSEFTDYQFSYFNGMSRQTRNVPKLTSQGLDLDATLQPIPSLALSGGLAYQEVKFGETGFPVGLTQLEGTTGPVAPRFVTVAAARYEHTIPGTSLTGFAYADMHWQSKINASVSATVSPDFMQSAYALFGARIGVGPQDKSWRLELWGRNLFDQRAWSILNNTLLQTGSVSGFVIEPRTVGLTLSAAVN